MMNKMSFVTDAGIALNLEVETSQGQLKKSKDNQYSEMVSKKLFDNEPEFQVLIDYLDNAYINVLPLRVLFEPNLLDAIANYSNGINSSFLDKKIGSRDYSYFQVYNILSSINPDFFIRLINDDLIKVDDSSRNSYYFEGTFNNKKVKICNSREIMYDKHHYRSIEFLMAQKKLTLCNLTDSIISFFDLPFEVRNNDENASILNDFKNITDKYPDLKTNYIDTNISYVKALNKRNSR